MDCGEPVFGASGKPAATSEDIKQYVLVKMRKLNGVEIFYRHRGVYVNIVKQDGFD
jgi:hypothetical protein